MTRTATIAFTCDCGRCNESLEPVALGPNEVTLACKCGVRELFSFDVSDSRYVSRAYTVGPEPGTTNVFKVPVDDFRKARARQFGIKALVPEDTNPIFGEVQLPGLKESDIVPFEFEDVDPEVKP